MRRGGEGAGTTVNRVGGPSHEGNGVSALKGPLLHLILRVGKICTLLFFPREQKGPARFFYTGIRDFNWLRQQGRP